MIRNVRMTIRDSIAFPTKTSVRRSTWRTAILPTTALKSPEVDFTSENSDLISNGVLDSFDIVQLISDIESEFSISISALDLVPENFESIEDILHLINRYKNN